MTARGGGAINEPSWLFSPTSAAVSRLLSFRNQWFLPSPESFDSTRFEPEHNHDEGRLRVGLVNQDHDNANASLRSPNAGGNEGGGSHGLAERGSLRVGGPISSETSSPNRASAHASTPTRIRSGHARHAITGTQRERVVRGGKAAGRVAAEAVGRAEATVSGRSRACGAGTVSGRSRGRAADREAAGRGSRELAGCRGKFGTPGLGRSRPKPAKEAFPARSFESSWRNFSGLGGSRESSEGYNGFSFNPALVDGTRGVVGVEPGFKSRRVPTLRLPRTAAGSVTTVSKSWEPDRGGSSTDRTRPV